LAADHAPGRRHDTRVSRLAWCSADWPGAAAPTCRSRRRPRSPPTGDYFDRDPHPVHLWPAPARPSADLRARSAVTPQPRSSLGADLSRTCGGQGRRWMDAADRGPAAWGWSAGPRNSSAPVRPRVSSMPQSVGQSAPSTLKQFVARPARPRASFTARKPLRSIMISATADRVRPRPRYAVAHGQQRRPCVHPGQADRAPPERALGRQHLACNCRVVAASCRAEGPRRQVENACCSAGLSCADPGPDAGSELALEPGSRRCPK